MTSNWIAVGVLVASGAFSGCAGSEVVPGTNLAAPAAEEASYRIGPGDTLRVFVLQNPDLTTEVLVRPDGRISTPLVDDITAAGKTPPELARDIEVALGAFIRTPSVSVIVNLPTNAFSQVRVVGQATNPRAVPYRSGMTVLDVVIEVGGLSQFAAGNRAEIIRTTPSGQVEKIRVRLNDLINKGDLTQNLALQGGDVMLIPEARF